MNLLTLGLPMAESHLKKVRGDKTMNPNGRIELQQYRNLLSALARSVRLG